MLQRLMTRFAVVVLLASALAAAEKRATPDDPTSVILNAFRTHPIVALGEGQNWNVQGHAYRLSLIRDPRLPTVVNDIVVEFGDARYQHVMDRYVAGGDVPRTNCGTCGKTRRWPIPFLTCPSMRSCSEPSAT